MRFLTSFVGTLVLSLAWATYLGGETSMDNPAIYIPIIGVALVAIYLLSCIRILYEYERGVVFRLGRVLEKPKGPG
jgi:uncharacterized membrane protein